MTEDLWPSEPDHDDVQAKEELSKPRSQPEITRSLANVVKASPNLDAIIDCNCHSTRTKLLRVTAYVKRLVRIQVKREKFTSVELSGEEL